MSEGGVRLDPAINVLTSRIIGAAIEVHRLVGPGLLERAYEECLAQELALRDLPYIRQKPISLSCKGLDLEAAFRLDFVVADRVIVELKAVETLLPVHTAQVLSYLRFTGLPVGLLMNFHVPRLRDGIGRYLNKSPGCPSASSFGAMSKEAPSH